MRKYIPLFGLCIMLTPAQAGDIADRQAESIDIGQFHGVVYYTTEHDGYRVTATIAEGEDGLPVRFEATLTETQKLRISVPGKLGEVSSVLEMWRAGGRLIVSKPEIPLEPVAIAQPEDSTK